MFVLLYLPDMCLKKKSTLYISTCKILHKYREISGYLGALTLSSVHVEFLGLIAISGKYEAGGAEERTPGYSENRGKVCIQSHQGNVSTPKLLLWGAYYALYSD